MSAAGPPRAATAPRPLRTTNARTAALRPGRAQGILPVHPLEVATRSLPADLRAGILPGGHVVSDAQRILRRFRPTAEGRFVTGGRGSFGATDRAGPAPMCGRRRGGASRR